MDVLSVLFFFFFHIFFNKIKLKLQVLSKKLWLKLQHFWIFFAKCIKKSNEKISYIYNNV